MNPHPRITAAVWVLNAVGFILYLVWLASSHERILTEREGVLFLLPCVVFLFIFVFLRGARGHDEEAAEDAAAEEKEAKETSWNAAHKP